MADVSVRDLTIGNTRPLTVIAGPCQLEGLDHALMIGEQMAEICAKNGLGFVFKASFDKANRSSISGKRGPGLDAGLEVLAQVGQQLGVATITDVHTAAQCAPAAQAVDILQIPAFLCRQTDLLLAAAETGKPVNVKKGQFLAPWDMEHVVGKLRAGGNDQIMLTERGTSFGYNTLVTDMRSLPQMAALDCPVIMDATHAVQMPGGLGGASGGQREFAPVLARAAVSLGIAGVFIETHQDPDNAPSDGPNMIALTDMPKLIQDLARFDTLAKATPL